MKKILVVLSLVSFLAVNVSVAINPPAAKATTKKETVAKTDEKAAMPACCKGKSVKDCTAEQMKSCTPAQKAACMKACSSHGEKAKAEAGTEKKDGTKSNNN